LYGSEAMGYNPMRVVYDYFMWLYFQYSVSLCLPLLEPWEIKMLSILCIQQIWYYDARNHISIVC